MPMAEYNQWVQFHEIEPFGPYFDDLRAASIAAAVYNVNRDPTKTPEPIYPSELAPWNALHRKHAAPKEPKKFSTPEQQQAAVVALVEKVKTK